MLPATTYPRKLEAELMDGPDLPLADALQALTDLDRVNAWLFGYSASRRTLLPRLTGGPRNQTVVDVGTGSGSISRSLSRHAAKRGVSLKIIGVDRKLCHLLFAARTNNDQLSVVADAAALPFRSGAVDWAFSNLLFHHFDVDKNRRVLASMQRVAKRGVVVVDLRRALIARGLIRLLLPLLRVGHVASYDGKLSTDQAWSLEEIERVSTGLPVLELRHRFPFRFSLVTDATNNG